MRMQPHEFILLLLYALGNNVKGKTLLQKLAFFAALTLGADEPRRLGYRAHYYGPYSDLINNVIGKLDSLGFLKEAYCQLGVNKESGFEVKRFDYYLTDDGRAISERLLTHYTEEWDKIKKFSTIANKTLERLKLDYIDISIAAKAYFLLQLENRSMSLHEIRKIARSFSWTIDNEQLDKSVGFLKQMNIIKSSS